MNNPTLHIEAARRHATYERLTDGNTRTGQARHLRQIVTPARTGGRTGRNRRRRRGTSLPLAIALMAGIAITLAVITALTIQP